MMVYRTIEYQAIEDRVALVRFKGDVNEQDRIFRLPGEFCEVCSAVAANNSVWVVLLMGVGNRACLQQPDTVAKYFEMSEPDEFRSPSLAEAIASVEKPVICGIDGNALGTELELSLACDIRIATEASRFGLPQLEHGLIPRNGGTQRLPRLVGKGRAAEMILTGEIIDAREAYRIGLISRMVSSGELEKTVVGVAKEMTAKAPLSLRYIKEAINSGMDLTLAQGFRLEADLYMLLHTSRDRTEGIRAFQEKRKADFKGK